MKSFLIAAIACLVAVPCAQAGAISKVPFVITKPGKYFLTKNLTPSNLVVAEFGAAITIQASNVELDLGGFSIISNPSNAGILKGIAILTADEVRVRNGRISGYANGITAANDVHHLLLEGLEITSPSLGASLVSKGTRVRDCSFILTSDTGIGLSVSSSGGGPAHTIESCNFYATVTGVAATQVGLSISGGAPTVVRDCEFIGWGQGLLGNNATTIGDNLFQDCGTKFSGATPAGFNQ